MELERRPRLRTLGLRICSRILISGLHTGFWRVEKETERRDEYKRNGLFVGRLVYDLVMLSIMSFRF